MQKKEFNKKVKLNTQRDILKTIGFNLKNYYKFLDKNIIDLEKYFNRIRLRKPIDWKSFDWDIFNYSKLVFIEEFKNHVCHK